jgi:hypothetical protein
MAIVFEGNMEKLNLYVMKAAQVEHVQEYAKYIAQEGMPQVNLEDAKDGVKNDLPRDFGNKNEGKGLG